jgi:hypothetical protein
MAFPWDHVQQRWIERRLAAASRRFETNVTVAGSSLEIDAAAEQVGPDAFFDFLGPISLFENKAPSEVFAVADLLLVGARTLLYAQQHKMDLRALERVTQVILCSNATAKLRRHLKTCELRPGIWEGRFNGRLVVVEANGLDVCEATLAVLVHYATGSNLRKGIELIVRTGRTEYYGVLWLLRRKPFQEVLNAMGQAVDQTMIDVREGIEELGIKHVVESVGLERVIESVGLERVIESVGLERVIESVGLERVIESVGLERVIESVGPEQILESLGLERAKQLIRQMEEARAAKPMLTKNRTRRKPSRPA